MFDFINYSCTNFFPQGVLAAVPLAYILPAVTYLKLDPGRLLTWEKCPAFLLALFGIVAAGCGAIFAILNVLDGITCSHGSEMPYCSDAAIYKFMNHTSVSSAHLLNSTQLSGFIATSSSLPPLT